MQAKIAMFQERLRLARTESEFSWKDITDAMGLSRQAIQSWESGETSPLVHNLVKLSELFGRPIGWFFGEPNGEANAEAIAPKLQPGSKAGKANSSNLLLERIERQEAESRQRHQELVDLVHQLAARLDIEGAAKKVREEINERARPSSGRARTGAS
jgi:transcriptional regulator with XRE-family HTH domain